MASRKTQKMRARERLAAERAARAPKQRRTRIAAIGSAGLAVVLLAALITWATVFRDGKTDDPNALPTPGSP